MDLEFSIDSGIATLRLNRPDKLNALTRDMADGIAAHCRTIARDPEVRAVLVSSAGRGFCSGADLGGSTERDRSVGGVRRSYPSYQEAIRMLRRIDKPVVAAVRGPCVGVGWSIALASDWLIASDTVKFSMIFLNRGILPDGGAIHLLKRQIGEFRAKELVFSRRFVLAPEAKALGLVTETVADAELDARAAQVARELADGPSVAIGIAKQLFHSDGADWEAFLDREMLALPLIQQTEDPKEGAAAWMEKRTPKFKGR